MSLQITIRRSMPILLVLLAPGCAPPESDEPRLDFNTVKLVPASGVVTLDGKPLAKAVVSFMPKNGPLPTGETDENGHFEMIFGHPGVPVGEYIVAVSYFVSAEGEPQGVAARSSLSPPPGMRTAKERLPRVYSALGESTLRAKIPPEGNTALKFDLKGPLLPPDEPAGSPTDRPAPESGANAEPAKVP
jgi:hypothetical protein